MIVAKMRARHVPMKVLRLQIQTEHVGEQDIQRARKIPHGIRLQVSLGVWSGTGRALASRTFIFVSFRVIDLLDVVADASRCGTTQPLLPRGIWHGGASHHIADLILIRWRNASASMRASAAPTWTPR